ncbi:hypothetical protein CAUPRSCDRAFT_6189, partial [Caulochytrium protostelioides]
MLIHLVRFLKDLSIPNLYLKYVHHLSRYHVLANNPTEGALALKLHANTLNWSTSVDPTAAHDMIPLLPPLQEGEHHLRGWETEFERKEGLYLTILELLEQGKAWEHAIVLCRELSHQYELTHDYPRLAACLRKMARLYENMAMVERFPASFYRVGFFGAGWPSGLKGREFIYRGDEWERIGPFCERILEAYRGATLIRTTGDLRNDRRVQPRSIQVVSVTPVVRSTTLPMPLVPSAAPTRQYYRTNEVQVFTFSRPLRKMKAAKKPARPEDAAVAEFLDLWTEKVFLITQDSFPHLDRRSPVVRRVKYTLSPIENAIVAIRTKTEQLTGFQRHTAPAVQAGQEAQVRQFTMALNGSVDAAVNGGIPMYRRAF